jgi:hypothetical protein
MWNETLVTAHPVGEAGDEMSCGGGAPWSRAFVDMAVSRCWSGGEQYGSGKRSGNGKRKCNDERG